MSEEYEGKFATLCEAEGYQQPLIMHDLTFARLIDEVIVPYEEDKPFFIDGVPLVKQKIRRLKILRQGESFSKNFHELHWKIRHYSPNQSKILAEQYHTRLEAVCRETCQDVTSHVIKAFNTEIKPRLREYLPNRKELIDAATRVFVESIRLLGGSV